MTPELFAQLVSAVGGPGAVAFLWLHMSRANGKGKAEDPVHDIALDLKEIKEAIREIETGIAVLLDRRK